MMERTFENEGYCRNKSLIPVVSITVGRQCSYTAIVCILSVTPLISRTTLLIILHNCVSTCDKESIITISVHKGRVI